MTAQTQGRLPEWYPGKPTPSSPRLSTITDEQLFQEAIAILVSHLSSIFQVLELKLELPKRLKASPLLSDLQFLLKWARQGSPDDLETAEETLIALETLFLRAPYGTALLPDSSPNGGAVSPKESCAVLFRAATARICLEKNIAWRRADMACLASLSGPYLRTLIDQGKADPENMWPFLLTRGVTRGV